MKTTTKSTTIKRSIIITIAMLCMFASRLIPPPAGLTADAVQIFGILIGSVLLWMTISIDWPSFLTMLAIGLMPIFGFSTMFKDSFGNSTFAFLIFTFMLTYPLSQTDFVRRCTIAFITNPIALKGPWWFMSLLFTAVTLMGCFISPSVLFVAFLPFLEDIYRVLKLEKGSKVAEIMMLGVAFCTSISSGMTPIGHVWPTLAIGFYKSTTGLEINQFQYMAMAVPTGIICIAIMMLVFRFIFKPNDVSFIDPKEALNLKGSLPKADRREIITLLAMGITIFLWVAPSLLQNVFPAFFTLVNGWTTAMPPLIGCLILSIATVDGKQIMNFKDATSKGVLWSSPIMCAAALVLGSCLTNGEVGLVDWLSGTLGSFTVTLSVTALVAFFVAWTLIQTNFASNIVTTTVVCSIAIPLLYSMPADSVSVAAMASIIGMAAAFAFMTPPGMTSVNGVAAASGWTNAKNMFIWGGILVFLSFFVMTFFSYPIGSLIMG